MDYQEYDGELPSTESLDSLFFSTYHRPSDASSCTEENSLFRSQWNAGMDSYQPDMECEESNQPERGIAGFVSKLYQCLQATDDGQKYARWCTHNGIDMFIIDCIPKFTEIVLPRLFKHCKFASFVRQLNIYGFQRDTDARKSKDSKDKETCRWYHIHFRPGRRDLFHLIRRKTPRYSRRKRSKVEEDPETILPVCSGEESENDEEASQDGGRRWSSSSASSSVTLQQVTEYKPQSLQMVFEKPSTQLSMAQQLQQPHHMHQPLQNQIPTRITSSSEEPSCYIRNLEESEAEIERPDESKRDPHDLAMHQTMAQEEQLRSQIVQLRREYMKMYKSLTGEVNKASSLISAQRSRIAFLESALRNVKLKAHHPHHPGFIDTNAANPFPLDYMIEQSTIRTEVQTPTTPLYSSTSSNQINQNTFLANGYLDSPGSRVSHAQGYNVFFSPNADDDMRLTSPCSNDKSMWLSTFQGGDQIMRNGRNLENASTFDSYTTTHQVDSPSKPNPFFGCDLNEAIQ